MHVGTAKAGTDALLMLLQFMIPVRHSKKCHRPRTSSFHKEQQSGTNTLHIWRFLRSDCVQGLHQAHRLLEGFHYCGTFFMVVWLRDCDQEPCVDGLGGLAFGIAGLVFGLIDWLLVQHVTGCSLSAAHRSASTSTCQKSSACNSVRGTDLSPLVVLAWSG